MIMVSTDLVKRLRQMPADDMLATINHFEEMKKKYAMAKLSLIYAEFFDVPLEALKGGK
jgi:hypothetical protein